MTDYRHAAGHFKGHRGLLLYYQAWRVERPKGVLVFVHGLGEHSSRYQNPISFFTQQGYTCYAYDHQGHGRSEGQKGYAPTLKSFSEDLKLFLKLVSKREKKKGFILIGHSLGGQIVLNYAVQYGTQNGKNLKGLITSSPNIKVSSVPQAKVIAAKLGTWLLPRLPLANEVDPKMLSHDRKVVRAYISDPLIYRKITFRLAAEILTNQGKMDTLAKQFKIPCLLLHGGGDTVCDPQGTKRFYELIPIKDKKLKIYEGLYHEIFNEFGKEEVFQDMENWIEAH